MNITEFLSLLKGVKPCGDGWQAYCPSHDDQRQSLHVSEGEDGRILAYCHAGCSVNDICQALGIELKDLFPQKLKVHAGGKSPIVAAYNYCDANRNLLFQVCRTADKRFFQRRPDGKGGWINGLGDVKPVLYRLPEVLQAVKQGETIFIPEGEKDVDNLARLGLAATCNPMGAGKWRDHYSEHLRGAKVVILPDNDEPGRKHAQQAAKSLYGKAASVKVLELPGLPEKGDISDWLAAGGTREELLELAAEAPEWEPEQEKEKNSGNEKDKPSQAELLIMLARDATLFHDPETDTAFASIPAGGHRENWPIRTKGFRRWLLQRYWEEKQKAPGAQALPDALGVLEAKAHFDGQAQPVYTRLGEYDGDIYLDLCNDTWEAIRITPGGEQIVKNLPVRFRRSKGMLPLPRPLEGGNLGELRQFVNIGTDTDWCLLVACLVADIRPTGPYPVLVLQGEQGSEKSTTAKVLRALIDPNVAPLRTAPREERDLAIAANNSWVLSFDNLSNVPAWLSDALCRVATGGGFATRTLYANDEETIFTFTRPTILNGIDEIIYRHDLLDRSIVVNLPTIPGNKRKPEDEFWEEFHKARPRILGALLNAVATGLKNIDKVELVELPRMADFAKWVTAAEPALPWEPGAFMGAYRDKRTEAVELALEGDAVAVAVQALATDRGIWEGTATELLDGLLEYVPEATQKTRSWPKTARTVANRLRRASTFLRQMGIEVVFDREGNTGRRLIRISRNSTVTTVTTVTKGPQNLAGPALKGVTMSDDE